MRRVVVVAAVLLAGCAAISGAADLSIDPNADDAGPGTDGAADGGGGADGARSDVGPSDDGASVDAGPDAPFDAAFDVNLDGGPTRLRTVTFENGSLTGTNGADTIAGAPVLVQGLLDGVYAMRARDNGELATVTFAEQSEVYVSMIVKLENVGGAGWSTILSIQASGTEVVGLQASDPPNGQLRLVYGGAAQSATAPIGYSPVRVGLHVKAGAVGQLEAYVSGTAAPFGAPFVTMSGGAASFVVPVNGVAFGAVANLSARLVVDDIVVDSASFP